MTTNIQKGGALLDDCRRVVELWDLCATPQENLAQIASQNALGKASRARTDDVLRRIIRPRLVEPGPHVMVALKALLDQPRSFREACYYEASRDEAILAACAEGPLWTWWQQGRLAITVADIDEWLEDLAKSKRAPTWTSTIRIKVARGLLAALRDFGVLSGAAKKEFSAPSMSPTGFAYVAWREYERGASSRALVSSRVWRRWLLTSDQVIDLFGRAAGLGVLRFSQAGSAVRVDWLAASLEEVARASR